MYLSWLMEGLDEIMHVKLLTAQAHNEYQFPFPPHHDFFSYRFCQGAHFHLKNKHSREKQA